MRSWAIVLVLGAISTALGQQVAPQSENRYVVVPQDTILLVMASQPDCPLKLQNARLLTSATGSGAWGASYELRNDGTKPIKTFTAVMWTSYGTGGTLSQPKNLGETLIMPGQTVKGGDEEIIPLTNEMRHKLNLEGRMKAIVVLMIESIKFADGSEYSDETLSQAVLTYFQHADRSPHNVNGKK
jgi:hypothetical protein